MTVTIAALLTAGVQYAPAASAADPVINIADTQADANTRSLYEYLQNTEGNGVLFGQQHAIDESISAATTGPDGQSVNSDVYATTGKMPGLFGFDGLAFNGGEKPGVATNTADQNADLLSQAFVRADSLGGVVTLSTHMPNFVTGGTFNDTSGGDVIAQIMPGGAKNSAFTAYLDLVARAAQGAKRSDGTLVPIIYRPFHENTGNWFWWGTGNSSAGEYKEIFRYTVEYLRNVKGVHNLLYAFSPNGSFGGDQSRYLATYPGDQWVDVMGYDYYQNDDSEAGTTLWMSQAVTDLAMISKLAAAHGKIPAMTEFGRGGAATIVASGNQGLDFFTRLLNAIKADPDASKIAYMLTWANFSTASIYVPYPGHEMAANFQSYESDPYTLFADQTSGRYGLAATAAAQQPYLRVVTPADGVRVTTATTTVRAALTGVDPAQVSSVTFWSGDDQSTAITLTHGADGYWSGTWNIGAANLTNTTVATHASAVVNGSTLTWDGQVILGSLPTFAAGVVDDFEGYGDDTALRAAYTVNNALPQAISLVAHNGGKAVGLSYDLGTGGYLGFGKTYSPSANWSGFGNLQAYIGSDGSGQKLVFQITTTDGTFEAYPSLATAGGSTVTLPWSAWVPASWDTAHAGATLTPQRLASITGFWIYLNDVAGAAAHSGTVVFDDIHAAGTGDYYDPNAGAASTVDDFESYADDTALRAVWGKRGKTDLLTLSSDAQQGSKAMDFAYDFTADGTWIDVSRAISGSWAGYTGLTLAYQGDGSDNNLALQIGTSDGNYWLTTLSLSNTAWQTVTIPWSSFTPSWPTTLTTALGDADLAKVSELVVAVASSGGTTTTGTVGIDAIGLAGSGATTIPDGTPETLDTFDSYASTDALRAAWANDTTQAWGDGYQFALATGKGDGGSAAAAFVYDFSSTSYQQESRWLGSHNWAGLDGVNAWIDPNGSGQTVTFRIRTPGADGTGDWYWDLPVALTGSTPEIVHLPFASATVSYPAGIATSVHPTWAQLAKVEEFLVMATRTDTTKAVTGTFYLDDLGVGDAPALAAPTVAVQPTSVTVLDGASVTLTAAATGNPVPTVVWQRKAPGGKSWTAVSGATSTSLTVTGRPAASGTSTGPCSPTRRAAPPPWPPR